MTRVRPVMHSAALRLGLAFLAPRRYGITRAALMRSPAREWVLRDLCGARRPPGLTGAHLTATMDWLARCHRPEGGLSEGYTFGQGWGSAYAETTGYSIPTLLRYAGLGGRSHFHRLAEDLGQWLMANLEPDGGVRMPGGVAVAFDTAQVLQGLTALHRATGDRTYLYAAARCARWLVDRQEPGGYWERSEFDGRMHAYSTRIASCMLEFDSVEPDGAVRAAARRNLEFVLRLTREPSWLRTATFDADKRATLHAIAYVAEGFLGSYVLTGIEPYLHACRDLVDQVLHQAQGDGWLPGAFFEDWVPDCSFTCAVGDAQIALICLKLGVILNEPRYTRVAKSVMEFVKSLQEIDHVDPAFRGAVPGSYPIYGSYAPFRFVNWGAKYVGDALILELETAQ